MIRHYAPRSRRYFSLILTATLALFALSLAGPSHGDSQEDKMSIPVAGEASSSKGKEVFDNNCVICHYRDKEKTKVGPGLKGLFKRKLTPARKLPLTEKTIRTQIQKGGIAMPPYSQIKGDDLDALLTYLKTL